MNKLSSRKFPRAANVGGEAVGGPNEPPRAPGSTETVTYLAGEVIGDRYRLVREVGRGGMGVVWVAHSLVLGVDVAVKLIRANATGTGTTSRMAREAHAAARLGHPALVRVFDFGWTHRGDPFLVMELVQGETLSALLERETRIAPIRAVQMLLPIADGLRLAHGKSIVHRDIKPDNIFMAKDALGRTQPKLIDFGIAKVGAATYDGKLTQVGAVLGSPEYMSPEQALGFDDVDERTDVWSLSVVLYEIVTGTIPFRKPNYNALMRVIVNEAPKPMTEFGVADATLWEVVERGLAKSRDERWPNITELGEALALWLYEHGIKEDISGNSIRAVWLDSALSGMRSEVPSLGAPSRPTATSVTDAAPRLGTTAAGTSEFASWVRTAWLSRWRARRNVALGMALGFGVLAGGFGTMTVFGAKSAPAAAAQDDAKRSTPTDATPTASAAATETTETPNGPPQVEAKRTSTTAREAKPAASPHGAAPPPKPEATAARPSTPRPAARPIAKTPRRWHDFGF